MSWDRVDWKKLEALRERFLSETPAKGGDYWDAAALESYDLTFGRRIGWKWDAVLEELAARGWHPPAGKPALLDWGCGTGVATRRMIARFGADAFSEAWLFDRSRAAVDYASSKIAGLPVRAGDTPPDGFVLLLSHVLNELSDPGPISALAERAAAVLWVEPGTPDASRKLIAIREEWRSKLRIVAPCTHQRPCGLLAPENARHWCHHFAKPPGDVFRDAGWRRFSTELGIDLRALPVSYLVVDRGEKKDEARARVIGRPRLYKGYAQYLHCDAGGVTDRKVMRRKEPELFEALEENAFARFVEISPGALPRPAGS